jgi:hypothetical protein
MGRHRVITREQTLADIQRLRGEGLSLRQIERRLRLAKSTVWDALHPDRIQAAREAKAAGVQAKRTDLLTWWNAMLSGDDGGRSTS